MIPGAHKRRRRALPFRIIRCGIAEGQAGAEGNTSARTCAAAMA